MFKYMSPRTLPCTRSHLRPPTRPRPRKLTRSCTRPLTCPLSCTRSRTHKRYSEIIVFLHISYSFSRLAGNGSSFMLV